jgi:hypothetical protein
MSALSMSATLLDISKRIDPDGSVAMIIEQLAEDNQILQDMAWMECNQRTNHLTTVRNGLPTTYWRKYNKGTPSSQSTTTQITDPTAMLEGRSNVDAELVEINAGKDEGKSYRFSEDVAFLEAMNQKVARTLFYGSSEDSDQFVGFAERYNSYQTTDKTLSSYNVLDAGGTGTDNTSIWLIGWGDRSTHGLYPQGSNAGFSMEDLKKREVQDEDGNEFTAYTSKYTWKPGLTLRDWRYVVRIANIDVSNLSGGSAADLVTLMIKAQARLPLNMSGVKPVWYCNETIQTYLDLQLLDKSNACFSRKDLEGEDVLMFRGKPVRRVDQLLDTEAVVPAAS